MGAAVAMGGAGREQRAAGESTSGTSGGAPMVAVAYDVMDMESAEAASAGAGGEGQRAVWATVVAATTAHVSGVTVHTRPPRAAVLGSATSVQHVTGASSRSAYATANAARKSKRRETGDASQPGKRRARAGADMNTDTDTARVELADARGDARGCEKGGGETASGGTATDTAHGQESSTACDGGDSDWGVVAQRARRARTAASGHAATRTRSVARAASSRAYDEATDAPT